MKREVKFIPGTGEALTFNAISGFAINPFTNDTSICFSGDFRNQVLTVVGTGTVIVYGSTQKDPPDFTAPSTITNSYAPVMLADYAAVGTYYVGASGVPVAGATKIVEVNTNVLTWVAIHRSANTVDVKLTQTDNQ